MRCEEQPLKSDDHNARTKSSDVREAPKELTMSDTKKSSTSNQNTMQEDKKANWELNTHSMGVDSKKCARGRVQGDGQGRAVKQPAKRGEDRDGDERDNIRALPEVNRNKEQARDRWWRSTLATDRREKLASRTRRKADKKRADIRKEIEDEMNRITKGHTNYKRVVEKISSLEKERAQQAEWLQKAKVKLQVAHMKPKVGKAEGNLKGEYGELGWQDDQLATRMESGQARLINQEPGLSVNVRKGHGGMANEYRARSD